MTSEGNGGASPFMLISLARIKSLTTSSGGDDLEPGELSDAAVNAHNRLEGHLATSSDVTGGYTL